MLENSVKLEHDEKSVVVEIIELVDANKTKAAFLAPVILAAAGAVGSWIVTGNFDDSEIRTAASGALLAAASGVATWLTGAKEAVITKATARRVAR